MNTRFHGKVAIVTGAASGIGKATAKRLSDEGAAVAILDLNGDLAKEVADSLPAAISFGVDVTDEAAVRAATAEVMAKWGRIDILVNNAGGMAGILPIEHMTMEVVRRTTEVNYLSQWICTLAVLPALQVAGGSIVNISSGSAQTPVYGMAAYGSAKAAVSNFTEACAREFGGKNIRVNAIVPGYIQFDGKKPTFTEEQAEMIAQQAMQRQALKQIGMPSDIAAAVAFLCSEDARHITGIELRVSGG
jgi:NAD(P)-dependent dehydrogenase (short-subunit alcohol dehydrogenase family)